MNRLTGGFFGWTLAHLAASMSICRRTPRSVRQANSAAMGMGLGEGELPGPG